MLDARLGAKQDEEIWEEKVSRWNKRVEELDRMHDVPPKVDIEKREYTVPLVEPWKLPTTMQWELSWDNQVAGSGRAGSNLDTRDHTE